jgi:hypothetical protein
MMEQTPFLYALCIHFWLRWCIPRLSGPADAEFIIGGKILSTPIQVEEEQA